MATHSSILAWSTAWAVQSMGLQRVGHDRASCFPGVSDGKASACNAGDLGSIPGSGKSPGGGHSNPLHGSGLENPMDCIVHGSQRAGQDSGTLSFSLRNERHLFPVVVEAGRLRPWQGWV